MTLKATFGCGCPCHHVEGARCGIKACCDQAGVLLPEHDTNMGNVAHISGENRRGVVYAGDKVYVIEHGKPGMPEVAGNTHIGMWMGGTRPIQQVSAGDHPFPEAYEALRKAIEADEKPRQ